MDDREVTRLLTVALPPDEPPMITATEMLDGAHRRHRRRLVEAAAVGGVIVLVGGIATGSTLLRADHRRPAAAPPGSSSPPPASSTARIGAADDVTRLDRAIQQAITAGTPPRLRAGQDPFRRVELQRDAAGTWHALYRGAEPTEPNSNVRATEFRFTIAPRSPSGTPCQVSQCQTTTRPDGSTARTWETSTPKGAGCTYAWWAAHDRADGSRVTVELSADVSQGCAMIDWIYDVVKVATYPGLHG